MKKENFVEIKLNNETEAIEISHKLQDLALRGDLSLGYNVILRKGQDGKVEVLKKTQDSEVGRWEGFWIGMIVGIFMGPLGFIISILAGSGIGAGVDIHKKKFYEKITKGLQEDLSVGKILILANVEEQSDVFLNEALKDYNCEIERFVS